MCICLSDNSLEDFVSQARILVIDDDASYARSLSTILGHFGYEAIEAGSGVEALKALRRRLPDLILLDWHLGRGLSGLDVLKAVTRSQTTRAIPVVVISAVQFTPDDERTALQNGASVFLHKDEVEAQISHGNHFLRHLRALLPKEARESATHSLPAKPSPSAVISQKGSILIVDDDPEFVYYLRTVLAPLGYQLNSWRST